MKNNEAQRESRKKEKMERELKMSKNELESKAGELKTKQNQLQKAQEEITRYEQQLKEQKVFSLQRGHKGVRKPHKKSFKTASPRQNSLKNRTRNFDVATALS